MKFTRSRPYKQDDNAPMKQKHWTHIPQWLGYERHDHLAVGPPLNALTTRAWGQSVSRFRPALKLSSKGAHRQPETAPLCGTADAL